MTATQPALPGLGPPPDRDVCDCHACNLTGPYAQPGTVRRGGQ